MSRYSCTKTKSSKRSSINNDKRIYRQDETLKRASFVFFLVLKPGKLYKSIQIFQQRPAFLDNYNSSVNFCYLTSACKLWNHQTLH